MNSRPVSVPLPVSTYGGHAHAGGGHSHSVSPNIVPVPVFQSKVANVAINQYGQPVVLIENQVHAQAKSNTIYVKPTNSSLGFYQVSIPNLHDTPVPVPGGGGESPNPNQPINNDHVILQCKHPGCTRQIKVPDMKFRGYDFFEPTSVYQHHQIPTMVPFIPAQQHHQHQGQVMFYNYNQNVQQPVQQMVHHQQQAQQQCTVEEIKEVPSASTSASAAAENANENKKGKKFVKYNYNYNKPQQQQQTNNKPQQQTYNKPQHQANNNNNKPQQQQQQQQKQQHHKQLYCKFCCDNRESEETYSSHNTKDENGVVTCPILKKRVCEKCGQSGHTRSYCHGGQGPERHASASH